MSIKLTVSTVLDALEGLPQDAPVVFAEVSEPGHPDVIAPIDSVEAIDANLNYSWDGDNLDESGCIGEPAVVIWWKDSKHSSPAPARPVQHRLITWGGFGQPPLADIASATTELSRAGTVYIYQVKDTGSAQRAAVISTAPLDEAGVQSVFHELSTADGPEQTDDTTDKITVGERWACGCWIDYAAQKEFMCDQHKRHCLYETGCSNITEYGTVFCDRHQASSVSAQAEAGGNG